MTLLRLLVTPLLLVMLWQAMVGTYLALVAFASFFYRSPARPTAQRAAEAAEPSPEADGNPPYDMPETARTETPPLRNRRGGRGVRSCRRFVALIPAHNEEALLGRLLNSLAQVDYPTDCYDVVVVADNCSDATAAIARQAGVSVFERYDSVEKGKGQALRWLMQRIDLASYDAVFIVDADSVVSPNVFDAANRAFESGARLAQIYDGVHNRDDSPATGLRALAFDLHNRVRPMGRQVLGVSVGLMGNGMFISTELLDGAWDSFGLAEDMEAHARLVARGERVHFIDEASALAEMPASLADSEGQHERWEAGRIDVARRHVPTLLKQVLRNPSWPRAATALDLSVPPQSAQVLLAVLAFAVARLIGTPWTLALAAWTLAAQAAYLSLGLVRLGREGARIRDLLHAPGYILWKATLYIKVIAGRGTRHWVRGHRNSAGRITPEE